MPSISARMSGSSSTIRISCAMRNLCSLGGPGRIGRALAGLPNRQDQGDPRAGAVFTVLQHQPPPMVLHDLLHDGKAKPRALRLMSDIGLGQPVPVLLRRQADSVV